MKTKRSSRGSMILVALCLVLAVYGFLPSQTYASSPPPSSPIVPTQDDACGSLAAGVVQNNSSFNIRIRGNITEGGPIVTYTLLPGQNSESDTIMCDVDDVNVRSTWWWLWYWRTINDWVKIYSWNITCRDYFVGGPWGLNVRCTALWMAPPEDGIEEPPIDVPENPAPPGAPPDPPTGEEEQAPIPESSS